MLAKELRRFVIVRNKNMFRKFYDANPIIILNTYPGRTSLIDDIHMESTTEGRQRREDESNAKEQGTCTIKFAC